MAKYCDHDIMDYFLSYFINNGGAECLCSAQPASYNDAVTNYMLASATLTPASYAGPMNGDVSGRKITITEQDNIPITNGGNAICVALVDTVNLVLLYVTPFSTVALVAGNQVIISAWSIEIPDPT